jgi:hypothetical protein
MMFYGLSYGMSAGQSADSDRTQLRTVRGDDCVIAEFLGLWKRTKHKA